MKNLLLIAALLLSIVACDKEETVQEVKFSVTGISVTDAKFNYKSSIHSIGTPFDGTRDTTIIANIGESISLDAKATGGPLTGQIFVNDVLVAEQNDEDADADGKTQVKINWTIK